MELEPHISALQNDLEAAGALGADGPAKEAAARLAAAIGPSLRLRLLDVLTEVALEVTAQLPDGHVEVRLAGREPELVYLEETPAPNRAAVGEDAASARITLRLPESLKASVDAAAAAEGVSVNSWLIQAISRSVEPRRRSGVGRRLSGYAES